jgi:hypothetical protein
MRAIMRSIIIATLCVQSVTSFWTNFNNFRSKILQKPLNEEATLNETDIYYNAAISTEIYDEPSPIENCSSEDAMNENEVVVTEVTIISADIEMIHIQMTPEEYKEYFTVITDHRKREWDIKYGNI